MLKEFLQYLIPQTELGRLLTQATSTILENQLCGIAHKWSNMANFTFYTGTMLSGKTTHLLQAHYNTQSAFPGEVVLINKNDHAGESVCTNRMGGISLSTGITDTTSIITLISEIQDKARQPIRHVFVDEAQFLSLEQVEDLSYLTDVHDIEVHAYGLLTTYKGTLFPATKRILELADKIVQIENGMRCWCGSLATHNALFMCGDRVSQGKDEILDKSDLVYYQVLCRKHFIEHLAHSPDKSSKGNKITVS